MSHLVACHSGRPAFRFRLAPHRIAGSCVFTFGWRRRRPVGAGGSGLFALQSGLEEPRDPLEGRSGAGGGLVLVNLAGMLAHGGGDDKSGWWLVAVVCGSVAACLELYGGGEAVQWTGLSIAVTLPRRDNSLLCVP